MYSDWYSLFMREIVSKFQDLETLKEHLLTMDKDGDGKISAEELWYALRDLELFLSESSCKTLFRSLGEGNLSL